MPRHDLSERLLSYRQYRNGTATQSREQSRRKRRQTLKGNKPVFDVDRLENKLLLSADVVVNGGNLEINDNDAAADNIAIVSDNVNVTITTTTGTLTTVIPNSVGNGTNTVTVPHTEITGTDLVVNAGVGDDTVAVQGLSGGFSLNVTVIGEAGTDSLILDTAASTTTSAVIADVENISIDAALSASALIANTDTIAINAAVDTTGGPVIISPVNIGTTVGIGDGDGTLQLSEAELANISTVAFVEVGRADGTGTIDLGTVDISGEAYDLTLQGGNIDVTGEATLPSNQTFTLFSNGAINDHHGNRDIVIGGTGTLVLDADTGIGTLTGDPGLEIAVANVAAQTRTSGVIDIDALEFGNATTTIVTSGAVTGVTSANGNVIVEGVSLVVDSPISAAGSDVTINASNDITLNADVSNGGGAEINISAGGTLSLGGGGSVTTTNAAINLLAPTAINVAAGGSINGAAADITLQTDSIDLAGTVSGTGFVIVSPNSPSTTIGVGGGVGALNVDDAEITQFVDGFDGIVFGTFAGTNIGAVDVDSSVFLDDVGFVGGSVSITEVVSAGNGVVVIATTGSITDGGDIGTDIVAADILLQATAGGIGAAGDSLSIDGDTLATDTSNSGAGQWLSEDNVVTWNDSDANVGTIWLTGGRFNVGNGQTITAAGVTVNSGATLGGEGTVDGAVDSSGTVSPGTSPGVLTAGNTTLADNSTFDIELGGTNPGNTATDHDQLVVNGTVTIGDNVTLSLVSFGGYVPVLNDSYTIIDNDGADAVTGTFDGLSEGMVLQDFLGNVGMTATISYQGGDGNDVVITVQALDFGDAPGPYAVTIADGGPRHAINGPFLGGGAPDSEADGVNSAAADSDDATNGDEDGVAFGTVAVGDVDATVAVTVGGGGGLLDAWIDFNDDGSFSGASEQIFDSVAVVDGVNNLTFSVPGSAVSGTSYARFRISTGGGLGLGGTAADGEVEDYQLTISPPLLASGDVSGEHIVSASATGARDLISVDFDKDGDIDVVAANNGGDVVVWYENTAGDGTVFDAHIVDAAAPGVNGVFVADINNDGDLDILAITEDAPEQAYYYENDGTNLVFTRTSVQNVDEGADIIVADLDDDGDPDLITASLQNDQLKWLENNGSGVFTEHTIDTPNGPNKLDTADVDSDGDLDIIVSLADANQVVWYSNDGNESFTSNLVQGNITSAAEVDGTDLDQDGDTDILVAIRDDNTIAWYENDGAENFTERVISNVATGAASVFGADVDGDGDNDVVASLLNGQQFVWYENDGSESFTTHIIATAKERSVKVEAADVDGDGDLDVVSAAGQNTNTIAWYEQLNLDYADAPAPYDVLFINDGPRHIDAGPTLGATRDSDADGVPSAAADGDGADEDGVVFNVNPQVSAYDNQVDVTVAGGAAKLDAWIDFDGDGSFSGAFEQIFDSVDVVVGANTLFFDVPSWAHQGDTVARFRLSTAGGLGEFGLAMDGEVEDYIVTIDPPATGSGAFASETVVDDQGDGIKSIATGDIDNDGDLDVLVASFNTDTITWHENDGSGTVFTRHEISITADGAAGVFAADIDADGDLDVVSVSRNNDHVEWHENDGAGNFTTHVVVNNEDGADAIYVGDFDQDGDVDLVTNAIISGDVSWFENDGTGTFTDHIIHAGSSGGTSVFTVDIDSDNDLDIVATSQGDDTVAWYENDSTGMFTRHVITNTANGAQSVFGQDMDGDGDTDLVVASATDDTIGLYRNDGAQNFSLEVITASADNANTVVIADIDGDNDPDVVATSSGDNTVAWFENDGNAAFTRHVVMSRANGVSAVAVGDVENDGDQDIITMLSETTDTVIVVTQVPTVYSFSAGTYTVAEGDATNTTSVVTVNRVGQTPAETVDVVLTGISATDGTDFTSGPITVTFGVGDTSQTVDIELLGESLVELDETLELSFANFSGAGVSGSEFPTSIMTITNDDSAIFSVADASANEDTGELVLTVSLDNPVDVATAVNISTADNTAMVLDTDYTALIGTTVNFAATETTQQVTVTLGVDNVVELDETFTATLSNVNDGGRLVTASATAATGTIVNDDSAEFSIDDQTSDEDSGAQVFNVSLSNPVDVDVTVVAATADDTATVANSDYTPRTVTMLFTAGSTTGTVTITPTSDVVVEDDETYTVDLSNVSNQGRDVTVSGTAGTGTGTITNDDSAEFSINSVSAMENHGSLTFTVTLSNPSDIAVSVDVNTADDSAMTGDSDYVGMVSQTVSFAAGVTSQEVTVTVNGDNIVELDETLTTNLDNVQAGGRAITASAALGTGTIRNDDSSVFTINNVTNDEDNGELVFTVTLNNPVDTQTTVDLTTVDATATIADSDYTALAGQTVTFATGSTSQSVTVAVTADNQVELDEWLTVGLSNVTNSGRSVTASSSSGTGTITNDDAAQFLFTAADVTDVEDSGQLLFNVELSNPVAVETSVVVVTHSNTATVGDNDYTPEFFSLVFAAGVTSLPVDIPVTTDSKVELDETFTVELRDAAINGHSVTINATNIATGTIENDDSAEFTIDSQTGNEDSGDLTFNISLSNPVDTRIFVDVTTADVTATLADSDYTQLAGQTITFDPGVQTGTVTFSPTSDNQVELDESATLSLGNVQSDGRAVTASANVGTATIVNDDSAEFTINSVTDVEDAGQLTFTVTLSNPVDVQTTVDVTPNDNTAVVTDDFTAGPYTVTFVAGSTSETVSIPTTVDTVVENHEDYTTTLGNVTNQGRSVTASATAGTGSIQNDDITDITIDNVSMREWDLAATEPREWIFTITSSLQADIDVTVDFATSDDTTTADVDYQSSSGTLTFAPGTNTLPVTVIVNPEVEIEGDESFFVDLSNGSFGTNILDNQGVGTLEGDDHSRQLRLYLDGAGNRILEETNNLGILLNEPDTNTGQTLVTGANAADILTIDFINGNPIPVDGVLFNGNLQTESIDPFNPTEPFDQIVLSNNGGVTAVDYDFFQRNGTIDITDAVDTRRITFTSVEEVFDNLDIADRVVPMNARNEWIRIADDGDNANGTVQVTVDGSDSVLNLTALSNSLTVSGTGGDDQIFVETLDTLFTGTITVEGADGDDYIDASTSTDDVIIDAGDGNDTVFGGTGNDTITGNTGSDTINAGDGDDLILWDDTDLAADGSDTVDGGAGNDTYRITTGAADDVFNIQPIDEQFSNVERTSADAFATNVQKVETLDINSGDGDDVLVVGRIEHPGIANVQLDGDLGNDRIDVLDFLGASTLMGGDGNDSINGGGGTDDLQGGPGIDLLDLSGLTGPANANLLTGTFADHSHIINDTAIEFEQLLGTIFDDTLQGGAVDELIMGNSGNDIIHGGDGDDTLVGMAGRDTISGGNGVDVLDYNQEAGRRGVIVRLGTPNGTARDTWGHRDTTDTIEHLRGTARRDNLQGDAAQGDIIEGLGGNDRIVGLAGDDTLLGGDGRDLIHGRGGNDSIEGGDGNDLIQGHDGDDYVHGNDGNDRIYTGSGNDTIEGGDGNDNVIADRGDDFIDGGEGNNRLHGHIGNDTIIAGSGNDILSSQRGDSVFIAGDGNNRVTGGRGSGVVITGSGRDIIVTHGNDDVIDSGAGNDFIRSVGGDNVILAGAGDDRIITGRGNNTIDPGTGDDFLRLNPRGNTQIVGVDLNPVLDPAKQTALKDRLNALVATLSNQLSLSNLRDTIVNLFP